MDKGSNMPSLARCFRDHRIVIMIYRKADPSNWRPRLHQMRWATSAPDDLRGDAHGGRALRNIVQDHGIGTDLGMLPDSQSTDDLCACTHIDVAFQGWHAACRLANRD